MKLFLRLCIISFIIIAMTPECKIGAQTSVRSERSELIAQLIWHGKFAAAIDSCQKLNNAEPNNPLGHFLMGMAYYSINNQYRNDQYADSVAICLDKAIKLANKGSIAQNDQAEYYLILGSAYGVRALYRWVHGGWFGAFIDGNRSSSNLQKAYNIDSTFTDALSGIGTYHYWKSAKVKKLAFLPFVGDNREQAIAEILRGVQGGGIMSLSARKSLLAIYYNEKKFENVIALADSLDADSLLDPNSRLHKARALIALRRFPEADKELEIVQSNWRNSIYYDICGANEVTYLKARLLFDKGDTALAEKGLQQVLSLDRTCKHNAYFRQTITAARGKIY